MRGPDVIVCVCTYRRQAQLRRLLFSLARLDYPNYSICVVDNDPNGGAREIVAKFPHVIYRSEIEPGIVAARNAALAFVQGAEAVAFVDDDEIVSVSWLSELVQCANEWDADLVVGPVISLFPKRRPAHLRWINVHERRYPETEAVVKSGATNNMLIASRELIAKYRFDARFNMTGGEDADYFARANAGGFKTIFTPRAIVYEPVHVSRLNARWAWSRAQRLGQDSASITFRGRSRWMIFLTGLARISVGCLGAVLLLFRPSSGLSDLSVQLPKGLGMIRMAVGKASEEYSRD